MLALGNYYDVSLIERVYTTACKESRKWLILTSGVDATPK